MSHLLRFLGEVEYRPPRWRPGLMFWSYRRIFHWRTQAVWLALLVGLAGGFALAAAATPRSGDEPTTLVSRPAERTFAPPPSRRPEPTFGAVGSPAAVAPPEVGGTATWYCWPGRSPCTRGYPDGLYAAAGPALRAALGDWRGRTVRVCAAACVEVTLIDACQCPGGRVIDLYGEAFARLAPLSRGIVSVEVSW